jgi:hypothetical protein
MVEVPLRQPPSVGERPVGTAIEPQCQAEGGSPAAMERGHRHHHKAIAAFLKLEETMKPMSVTVAMALSIAVCRGAISAAERSGRPLRRSREARPLLQLFK